MIAKQKVVDIYNNIGTPNWTSGKNVTRGWVNIQCPFCSDASNHCGVNPATELFSCWKCGKNGHFVDILIELTGLPFGDCKEMISGSSVSFKEPIIDKLKKAFYPQKQEEPESVIAVPRLPKIFELVTKDINFPLLDMYLERRNVLKSTLIEHRCGVCRTGEYANRLIFPVYYQGKLVSFQAADLSGFADLKYQSAPLEMGRINDYLYGLDGIDKRMIVVEGILDKLRTGVEAVAAFTSTITEEQIKLILNKGLDELYICFDCELLAYYKSVKEAKIFEAYIPKVEVLMLPYGKDPDEVGQEEIYRLIEETFV